MPPVTLFFSTGDIMKYVLTIFFNKTRKAASKHLKVDLINFSLFIIVIYFSSGIIERELDCIHTTIIYILHVCVLMHI